MRECGWFKETLLLTQADSPVVFQMRKQLSAAYTISWTHTHTSGHRYCCGKSSKGVLWNSYWSDELLYFRSRSEICDWNVSEIGKRPSRYFFFKAPPSLWATLMFLDNMFLCSCFYLADLLSAHDPSKFIKMEIARPRRLCIKATSWNDIAHYLSRLCQNAPWDWAEWAACIRTSVKFHLSPAPHHCSLLRVGHPSCFSWGS